LHSTDIVIEAIGSRPESLGRETYPQVKVAKNELIIADQETGRTNVKGIYAGGDIVRGPSLIVHAVRDGKVAAKAILEDLN
jgi:NADPH-dependent glutamate synthase beta subunit-like oxidoreductase